MAASVPRHHRLIAVVFGAAMLLSGGLVLLGPPATQSLAGDVVLFVLWFNFAAGAVYLLATLAIFAAFAVLALRGTPHEPRTIGALTLRSGFWLASAIALRRRRASSEGPRGGPVVSGQMPWRYPNAGPRLRPACP